MNNFQTILYTKAGSHAYGMNTPNSDKDFRGVCVGSKESYLSPFISFEQYQSSHPDDVVIYEIKKFCALAAKANPNIWDVLWCREEDIVTITEEGKLLRDNRDIFLSSRAKHTFAGYANSQLRRIKSHRGFILNPIKHQPTRKEFGLPNKRIFSATDIGIYRKLETEDAENFLPENIKKLYYKEQEYNNAMTKWHQYTNWKQNRNKDRSILEKKYFYDTKHASHLVRLITMCKEILKDGEVNVYRPDRELLLSIRNGKWNYKELILWLETQEKELEKLYINCNLPTKPNSKRIEELCIEIIERKLYGTCN